MTALGLAGCTGDIRKTSPFWSTVTNTRPQKADDDIRAYADSLPYASMLFWFDGQSRSLIVLGKEEPEDRLTWYTAEKQAVTTFGPFITRAIGTEVELRSTTFGPGWSSDVRQLAGKSLTRQTVVAHRNNEVTATLTSRFHNAGMTMIKVLGKAIEAYRIDESMIADNRVRILNSYWVDPATGAWLKTRQQVIPLMSPVNTAMLKPPTG
ncbi:YjbF family lipoprotein [Polymorphobacter fuscus]|uniref:YjbF family lipoprotein n=1 Tax=Sandarakinorhabdus fusca TaxID=1439888 RepID=UPI0014314228|nr:YjbF family lipoprotein [Polymorphobacter fuscus]NJC08939.1 hypothetical protein [Polymorphobacter fuscus]